MFVFFGKKFGESARQVLEKKTVALGERIAGRKEVPDLQRIEMAMAESKSIW